MISALHISDLEDILSFEEASDEHPWNRDQLSFALQDSRSAVYAYRNGSALIALCIIKDLRGEIDLQHLVVGQPWRRKGIASMLLEFIFSVSQEKGADKIILEVRAQNVPAIALYERFGFSSDAVRPNYYKNPLDNALLMTRII